MVLLELKVQSHPVRGENCGPREKKKNLFEEATHSRKGKGEIPWCLFFSSLQITCQCLCLTRQLTQEPGQEKREEYRWGKTNQEYG